MAETNILGVFFSGALTAAVCACLLLLPLRSLLSWARFYQHVWHRHLVDLAFFVMLWALTALAMQDLQAGLDGWPP